MCAIRKHFMYEGIGPRRIPGLLPVLGAGRGCSFSLVKLDAEDATQVEDAQS